MEPLTIDRTHILVLNYNGRGLLAECLPSIIEAAARSSVPCRVTVVDNSSTDGSREVVNKSFPSVGFVCEPNRGLASFNSVLERCDEPVVLLLNNDVKLEANAIAPLLGAFETHDDAFFSAPCCWTFDGRTYEGMRTRRAQPVWPDSGNEQGSGLRGRNRPAGPDGGGGAGAGDRSPTVPRAGGLRPDLLSRTNRRSRPGVSVVDGRVTADITCRSRWRYHKGCGTFEPELGKGRCDELASRNTLIFMWKNMGGVRLLVHLSVAAHPLRRLVGSGAGRALCAGFLGARSSAAKRCWRPGGRSRWGRGDGLERQEAFFRRFEW